MTDSIEFKVSLFADEDPELVALLAPLGRYERARTVRRLLRRGFFQTGAHAEATVTIPAAEARPVLPEAFDPAAFTFGGGS